MLIRNPSAPTPNCESQLCTRISAVIRLADRFPLSAAVIKLMIGFGVKGRIHVIQPPSLASNCSKWFVSSLINSSGAAHVKVLGVQLLPWGCIKVWLQWSKRWKKKKSHESADSINIIQPKHVSAKSHNNQFCQILQQWFGTKPHLSTLFWASRRTQEMDFSKAWYLKVELPEPLINNVRRHGEKGLQFIIILVIH